MISYVIFMAQELRCTLTKTKHLRLYGPAIIFIARYIAIQISSSGKSGPFMIYQKLFFTTI